MQKNVKQERRSNKKAIIFSGHNQRAVISLCRLFASQNIDFFIISNGPGDSINRTIYKDNIIFERKSNKLNLDLFSEISKKLESEVIYCPTSEFLNLFIYDNRSSISEYGISFIGPERDVYIRVSDKKSSLDIAKNVTALKLPSENSIYNAKAPCVLKPIHNRFGERIVYPIICQTQSEINKTLSIIEHDKYFCQKYIDGQSYYLCGYISRNGFYATYWQENMLQQAGGKSIVLARTCRNPGLDEDELISAVLRAGYTGPIMIEIIHSEREFYYIEMNPRFWGPLQLAIDSSNILDLYLEDIFEVDIHNNFNPSYLVNKYYSWRYGAQQSGLRVYPVARNLKCVDKLLVQYDVFNSVDSRDLSGAA